MVHHSPLRVPYSLQERIGDHENPHAIVALHGLLNDFSPKLVTVSLRQHVCSTLRERREAPHRLIISVDGNELRHYHAPCIARSSYIQRAHSSMARASSSYLSWSMRPLRSCFSSWRYSRWMIRSMFASMRWYLFIGCSLEEDGEVGDGLEDHHDSIEDEGCEDEVIHSHHTVSLLRISMSGFTSQPWPVSVCISSRRSRRTR